MASETFDQWTATHPDPDPFGLGTPNPVDDPFAIGQARDSYALAEKLGKIYFDQTSILGMDSSIDPFGPMKMDNLLAADLNLASPETGLFSPAIHNFVSSNSTVIGRIADLPDAALLEIWHAGALSELNAGREISAYLMKHFLDGGGAAINLNDIPFGMEKIEASNHFGDTLLNAVEANLKAQGIDPCNAGSIGKPMLVDQKPSKTRRDFPEKLDKQGDLFHAIDGYDLTITVQRLAPVTDGGRTVGWDAVVDYRIDDQYRFLPGAGGPYGNLTRFANDVGAELEDRRLGARFQFYGTGFLHVGKDCA